MFMYEIQQVQYIQIGMPRALTFLLLSVALPVAAQTPACSYVPGWTQAGELRDHDKETLYEYMNGNSESYFAYGFVRMRGVTCKQGAATAIVDIFEMIDDEASYGMYVSTRDARQPEAALGAAAQVLPRRATVVRGKYYAEVAMEPEGDHSAPLKAWIQALAGKLPGSSTPPAATAWFPAEGRLAGSPRLAPRSVLGLRFLKRGWTADYDAGRAFVVPEATPEAARATFAQLKDRWKMEPATGAGEEFGCGEDSYLGVVCAFRKGARVGGWVKGADTGAAKAKAAALAARLP
jgi:hypothetical protein